MPRGGSFQEIGRSVDAILSDPDPSVQNRQMQPNRGDRIVNIVGQATGLAASAIFGRRIGGGIGRGVTGLVNLFR